MRLSTVCAVAAFAATALPFPASAYCRGCVVETARAEKASVAEAAYAAALPPIAPSCHVEKQWRRSKGRHRRRFVEICE